jgi:hypothetical protein
MKGRERNKIKRKRKRDEEWRGWEESVWVMQVLL